MNITLWNHWAEELWGLRADEVKDQALLTLDIGLPVELLTGHIRACLSGEAEYQELDVEAVNRRGRAFRCHIAIAPLFNIRHERSGVILLLKESGDDKTI